MADVTKDVALLPLPEKWTAYACMPQYEIMDLLHDYARANVEAATEALRKRCEAVEASLEAAERCTEALRIDLAEANNVRRQVQGERDALKADAERYRWLRANAVVGRMESRGTQPAFAMNCDEPESEWDACIDAHIAAAQEPSHG